MHRIGILDRILFKCAFGRSCVAAAGAISRQVLEYGNPVSTLPTRDLTKGIWSQYQQQRGAFKVTARVQQPEAVEEYTSMTSKDIFEKEWDKVQAKFGKNIVIPREIVFLNGAPGAGKGASTPFILRSRGLGRAVGMSDILLKNPDVKALMDCGDLIPDNMVLDALFSQIFDPAIDDSTGMIIDGFPRTLSQVDFIKLLYDRLMSVHRSFAGTSRALVCPRPSFKMVMLYVSELTSIRRQMGRGEKMSVRNARAADAGCGSFLPVRETDVNQEYCKKRYRTYMEHYGAIVRLKDHFPFHMIDGMGSLEDTRRQIAIELRYQSSHDLNEETYMAIKHLPKARELLSISRQQLPSRLDSYAADHPQIFSTVIEVIGAKILPRLRQCGMAGEMILKTDDKIFIKNPLAIDILIDVLTDRGFHVSYEAEKLRIPSSIDLSSGKITTSVEIVHKFKIRFRVSSVREDSENAWEPTTSPDAVPISTS